MEPIENSVAPGRSPRPEISRASIERAAQALHDHDTFDLSPWDAASEATRMLYWGMVECVVDALFAEGWGDSPEHDFQRTVPTDGRWCQRCGLSEANWEGDACPGRIGPEIEAHIVALRATIAQYEERAEGWGELQQVGWRDWNGDLHRSLSRRSQEGAVPVFVKKERP